MRRTVSRERPTSLARSRVDQWVWPAGGGLRVSATTLARVRWPYTGGRPERARSRRPARPSRAKRWRMRLTCTGVYPVRSATWTPPRPPLINSTTRARRASPAGPAAARCRCSSALRSDSLRTIASAGAAIARPPTLCWRLSYHDLRVETLAAKTLRNDASDRPERASEKGPFTSRAAVGNGIILSEPSSALGKRKVDHPFLCSLLNLDLESVRKRDLPFEDERDI